MRALLPLLPLLLWGALAAGCADGRRELEVFAAASLRESLEELAARFEERHEGLRVRLNLAASSLLAEQILATSRTGVFVSADVPQMERVALGKRLVLGTRRALLSNSLVVVVHPRDVLLVERPEDLARNGVRHLSLANPAAVPAGRYARDWLRSLGLWDDVAHKVAPALDVRGALAAVESGAAEAGIVYATDVATARRAVVALEVTGEHAPEIEYEAAVLAGRDPIVEALAREFVELLEGAVGREVFERRGFRVPARAH